MAVKRLVLSAVEEGVLLVSFLIKPVISIQDGLQTQTGKIYYLHPYHDGSQGYMYTGWNFIDGNWYYFETKQGKEKDALCKSENAG